MTHRVIDVMANLRLAVICSKQVRINFVDEHFVNHIRLHFVGNLYYLPKMFACSLVVLLLRVYHVDNSAAVFYLGHCVRVLIVAKYGVSWEVDDVEGNVTIVFHKSSLYLSRRLEVVSLMN